LRVPFDPSQLEVVTQRRRLRLIRRLVVLPLGVLVALALAVGISARTSDDEVGTIALKTVDTNVGDAIKLELNALYLAQHGNVPGARQELENSRSLLEGAFGAADTLTPPADLTKYVPDNSWERLGRNIRSAATEDGDALARPGRVSSLFVTLALQKKQGIFNLVHPLVKRPECSVLTDDRSAIKVNGVAQNSGQLSVDVSCTVAIKRILVETPKNAVTQTATDGDAKAAALKSANTVQVVVDGKEGGVTETTRPDPAAGLPVDVIVIVGDSTIYDPETM
jgi:hypothetical protein